MITIGLTGSIGMGKSTVAKMFEDLGAALWDADGAVHRLYAPGGDAVGPVGEAFPQARVETPDGATIDREKLSALVVHDREALGRLEAIVHPLVAMDRLAFGEQAKSAGALIAVLDVPLIFENGSEGFFDKIVVVSAPADVQRERVLARPGMSREKFEAILAKQMPDAEKRERADFVIPTGGSLDETRAEVARVWSQLTASSAS